MISVHCVCRYMACRQFLGDISVDRRANTLDLCVSTDMRDAAKPNWQVKVTASNTRWAHMLHRALPCCSTGGVVTLMGQAT